MYPSKMTTEELDMVKKALGKFSEAMKEIWLENQLLRNLILDSGNVLEAELDSALKHGKSHPENISGMNEVFESSDQLQAELGLAYWLEDFAKRFPRIH